MQRSVLALAALAAAATAQGQGFQSREIAPSSFAAATLVRGVAMDNGEIVLQEADTETFPVLQRFVRFSASGQFLGASPRMDESQLLARTPSGGLISNACTSRDVTEHSAAGQLRARFDRNSIGNTLRAIACASDDAAEEVGVDRDGRIFVLRNPDSVVNVHADAGSGTTVTLAQIAAGFRADRLYAWSSRHGAVLRSFDNEAVEGQPPPLNLHQFAAIKANGQIEWRYTTPSFTAVNPDGHMHHRMHAAANRDGLVALADYAYEHVGTEPVDNPANHTARGSHAALLDPAGQRIWHADLGAIAFDAMHVYDDGAMLLSDWSAPNLRARLFSRQGQPIADRTFMFDAAPDCTASGSGGGHWLICADAVSSIALSLDHGSSITLAQTRFTDVILRSDGSALIMLNEHAPYQAVAFNGTPTLTTLTLATPSGFPRSSEQAQSRTKLGDGDELLVWTDAIARVGSDGEERWKRGLNGAVQFANDGSWLKLFAGHACVALNAIDTFIVCHDLDNGERNISYRLSSSPNAPVWAVADATHLDVMFSDPMRHAWHWRIDVLGNVSASRDLGVADVVYLDADVGLARTLEGPPTMIRSDFDAVAPTTVVLAPASPLATDAMIAQLADGDWLSMGTLDTNGASSIHLRRSDAVFAVRWSREFDGASAGELVSADSNGIRLLIRTAGSASMQFLAGNDGTSTAQPLDLPDSAAIQRGPAGAFGIATPERGTIVWRAWNALGVQLASHAWRCPEICSMHRIQADADRLFVVAAADQLHELTLALPFTPRRAPVANDGAIAGVFTAVNETNRGYVIDWLPSSRTLFVARFAGDTSRATVRQLLDWETMQGTVLTPSSEIALTRYRSTNGRFAAADDAPIRAFGTATFHFDGCDRVELILTTDGTPAAPERLHLIRSGPRLKACNLLAGGSIAAQADRPARGGFDARQSGAWVAAGANDQGILAAVLPATADTNGVFFAPWFTYWPDAASNVGTSNRHWLTLQAELTPTNNGSVALTIFRATAGSYGVIRPSNTYRVGTATWTLTDCEHATLSYQFDADASAQPYSGRSGVQNYARPGACSGGP